MNNYILKGKEPIIETDLIKWAQWFKTADRHVKSTILPDNVRVSTIFLGMNHGFDGEILLFETMIFGGEHDGYCDRYSTWDQAEKGHEKTLLLVFE